MESSSYHTRQKAAVLDCFLKHPSEHFTADDLTEHLHREGVTVGKTTVYRSLEKLVESGQVRRFSTGGQNDSACYQYAGDNAGACASHFHMKCLTCGVLYHVDCELLSGLQKHLEEKHGFRLDYSQTVLYGTCAACAKKDEGDHSSDSNKSCCKEG